MVADVNAPAVTENVSPLHCVAACAQTLTWLANTQQSCWLVAVSAAEHYSSGIAGDSPSSRSIVIMHSESYHLIIAPIVLLLLANTAGAAAPSVSAPAISFMRIPDGGIQPQAVVDSDGTTHLIYFKGEPAAGDIFYVRRRTGEQRFSEPVQVNNHPGSAIAMGTIRGAQLAVGKGGRVHVAWNGSAKAQPRAPKATQDTPMLYTRLDDGGEAFEPQRNLIGEAFGLDGGGSIAADDQGNVYVAWHANPAGDGEANRLVYLARSTDEGESFAPEVPVSKPGTGVCGCCGIKAWADTDGRLLLLYRSATDVLNRDIYLLTSYDGGQTFDSQMVDQWNVATCPMSSAAFAEGPDRLVAGWETAGQVFFSQVGKDGPSSRPVPPASTRAVQKHPAAAINDRGEAIFVWTEGTGWSRGGSVAWRIYDAQGRPVGRPDDRKGIPVWSFAAVFAGPGGGFTIVY